MVVLYGGFVCENACKRNRGVRTRARSQSDAVLFTEACRDLARHAELVALAATHAPSDLPLELDSIPKENY